MIRIAAAGRACRLYQSRPLSSYSRVLQQQQEVKPQQETATTTTNAAPQKRQIKSSAPAGTILKGTSISKSGQDVKALPEDEYPDWLWELLDPPDVQLQRLKETDPQLYLRKKWRKMNKEKIKTNNFLKKMT